MAARTAGRCALVKRSTDVSDITDTFCCQLGLHWLCPLLPKASLLRNAFDLFAAVRRRGEDCSCDSWSTADLQPDRLHDQRKFSLKTSELRTSCMVMVSIHTIMSTTLSSSSCRAVGKCNSLEACEFTSENTLGRENLCFFWGSVALGAAEVGSLFPRLRASISESRWQKVDRTVARAGLAFQTV